MVQQLFLFSVWNNIFLDILKIKEDIEQLVPGLSIFEIIRSTDASPKSYGRVSVAYF